MLIWRSLLKGKVGGRRRLERALGRLLWVRGGMIPIVATWTLPNAQMQAGQTSSGSIPLSTGHMAKSGSSSADSTCLIVHYTTRDILPLDQSTIRGGILLCSCPSLHHLPLRIITHHQNPIPSQAQHPHHLPSRPHSCSADHHRHSRPEKYAMHVGQQLIMV